MPVTVSALLDDPALGLVSHTTTAAVDRPLSWVHVSELADPTPFLDGGELLLTTGLALLHSDQQMDRYVQRLSAAGVAALGLGTGLSHPVVPPELVAAADACGLAVVEVPRQTPFIALSRAVAAAVAADEYASISRTSAVQQELTHAAVGPAAAGPVEVLARHLGGWAVLTDAAGSPLEAAPRSAAGRVAGLAAELDRLRGLRAPASAALSEPTETVLLQSLGNGARTRGFLVVGRGGAFPAADRHVVNAAAALLTLRLEQSRVLDNAAATLRSALLQLLLAGQPAAVEPVVRTLGARLPEAPVRALVVLGTVEQRSAALDVAADGAAHTGEPIFCADLDDGLVMLVSDRGRLANRLAVVPDRVAGAVVGVAPPVPWPRLAEAVRQARQAAEHGRGTGRGMTHFTDLAGRGLAELLDPTLTRAFGEALLTPLTEADRAGAGELVESMRVWLAHHGQWEPAAAWLGVHRHTLRKRIRRAGELLGRDLDSPGVRAELWLALHPPGTSEDGDRSPG